MSALTMDRDELAELIRDKGLERQFDGRDVAYVDCRNANCMQEGSVRLDRGRGTVRCTACAIEGDLVTYLEQLELADNVVQISPDIPEARPARQMLSVEERAARDVLQRQEVAQKAQRAALKLAAKAERQGRLGERIIMTLLALIFLGAGLAAAALSGFANFQAFSQTVSDPVQGQIWGWSGVIASVCSFGGFTFFYWHTAAKRFSEGFRALTFALAGAATSIAGTAMFMTNNTLEQQSVASQVERTRNVIETQVSDWTRQLEGIPATTRSVAGLEAYISGVEAAGRTHQKPYRDAQNELGLAQRRADLEAKVSVARAQLLGQESGLAMVSAPERKSLPSWFFAVMLEVFSSQGTSIAFVSLLLLYGARGPARLVSPELQPG
ncbi:MAG: hypothetical protein L3J02_06020 [Henriciella sp.]|nr:hypothetical protein [Henriciella sp.]